MKKFLFAIGAAALVFTMTSCGDVEGSVGIETQSPGAPRNVTATASPDGNWALLSWQAGSNTTEGFTNYEFWGRPRGARAVFPLSPVPVGNFVVSYNAPLPGANMELGARGNNMTFSWNADNTLSWTTNANIDAYTVVVRLFGDRNAIEQLEIGVRTSYLGLLNQNWADLSDSNVAWARERLAFRRDVPSNVTLLTTDPLAGTAGTAIDLNAVTQRTISPANGLLQSVRWNVFIDSEYPDATSYGPWINLPNTGGSFTPSFAGTYYAMLFRQGEDTQIGSNVRINVGGTPFIPVRAIVGVESNEAGTSINLANARVVPHDATNSDIRWESRVSTDGGDIWGHWTAVTGTTVAIAANQTVEVRATIDNGLFWTSARAAIPVGPQDFPHFYEVLYWTQHGGFIYPPTQMNFNGVTGLHLNDLVTGEPRTVNWGMSVTLGTTINLAPATPGRWGVDANDDPIWIAMPDLDVQWQRQFGSDWSPIVGNLIPEGPGSIQVRARVTGPHGYTYITGGTISIAAN